MLYLSRFARPAGHGSLHRYVMAGFPDDLGPDPRKQAGVLFRVQVNREPDFFAAKNEFIGEIFVPHTSKKHKYKQCNDAISGRKFNVYLVHF